ncbi:translationally-controlled tumor protein [Aspergillus undulatus]|uniref:translationally-controlled tumor protein n=1 Tax=Aspergillus undulatus TaxID=1810928 RepID=UPI003CCDF7A2
MFYYNDVISNDALFSSEYPITEVDDIIYEVDCEHITIPRPGAGIEIGSDGAPFDADEGLVEGDTITVNNLIHEFGLQPIDLTKHEFGSLLKGYARSIMDYLQKHNSGRLDQSGKGSTAYAKRIMEHYADYQFYLGERYNQGAMVMLLRYREDGHTPYFTFWKDGLKEQRLT